MSDTTSSFEELLSRFGTVDADLEQLTDILDSFYAQLQQVPEETIREALERHDQQHIKNIASRLAKDQVPEDLLPRYYEVLVMLVQLAQPGIKRALARTPYFVHRLVTDLKSRCDDTESQIPFFVILLLLDLTTLNSDFEQGNKDTLIDVFDTLVDLVSAREQQEHVKQATASAVISIWNLFNQTDPDLSASFIDSIQRHNNARDFADTILSLLNRSENITDIKQFLRFLKVVFGQENQKLFFTNDLRLLLDIFIRDISNHMQQPETSLLFFEALQNIVQSRFYKEASSKHRARDIIQAAQDVIESIEAGDPTMCRDAKDHAADFLTNCLDVLEA